MFKTVFSAGQLACIMVGTESRGENGRVILTNIMPAHMHRWAIRPDNTPVIGSRHRLVAPWKEVRDAFKLQGRKVTETFIVNNPHECSEQLLPEHLGVVTMSALAA